MFGVLSYKLVPTLCYKAGRPHGNQVDLDVYRVVLTKIDFGQSEIDMR